jgi:hypothetical protein
MPDTIHFRLYATLTLYFNVFIHPTRKAMFAANPDMKPNFLACCRGKEITSYRTGKARKRGLCGDLHFFRKAVGTEIVSHELMHATLNVARRLKINPMLPGGNMTAKGERDNLVDPDEEKACLIHGRMMRRFVDTAYKKGVYQE